MGLSVCHDLSQCLNALATAAPGANAGEMLSCTGAEPHCGLLAGTKASYSILTRDRYRNAAFGRRTLLCSAVLTSLPSGYEDWCSVRLLVPVQDLVLTPPAPKVGYPDP